MFVEGFEPSASGFVDQRSQVPLSYTNKKSGRQDSNLRGLAPKASGQPLPHTQKMEPVGLEPTISSLQDWSLSNLATIPAFKQAIGKNRNGGNRTHDRWFVRPMLWPLSYVPVTANHWETWI